MENTSSLYFTVGKRQTNSNGNNGNKYLQCPQPLVEYNKLTTSYNDPKISKKMLYSLYLNNSRSSANLNMQRIVTLLADVNFTVPKPYVDPDQQFLYPTPNQNPDENYYLSQDINVVPTYYYSTLHPNTHHQFQKCMARQYR